MMSLKQKGASLGLLLAVSILAISYSILDFGAGSCGPGTGFLFSLAIFFGAIILSLFFVRHFNLFIKTAAQTFLYSMLASFVILLLYSKLH